MGGGVCGVEGRGEEGRVWVGLRCVKDMWGLKR